jgi:hypothetical protein
MKKFYFFTHVIFLWITTSAQVCPAGNNLQYNEVADLGGPGEDATVNPFTYSYTPGSGANRVLLLFITYETEGTTAGNNFSTITFGGRPLSYGIGVETHRTATETYNRASIYYLREVDIAAAVGNTVSIGFSSAASIRGVAVSTVLLQNVRQSGSPGTNTQSTGNGPATTIQTPFNMGATGGNFIFSLANMSNLTAPVATATAGHNMVISKNVGSSHTHSFAYKQLGASASERPGFTASSTYPQASIAALEIVALSNTGSVCTAVLPVRSVSFTGKKTINGVQLQWKTEDESGTAEYAVQKSYDLAGEFRTIATMPTRNSSVPFTYSFMDNGPLEGPAYYRLAVKDKSGSVTYSSTVKIDQERLTTAVHATTFLTDAVRLQVGSAGAQKATLILTDNSGKNVWQKTTLLQPGTNTIPIVALPSGLYYLTVSTEKETYSFKQIRR